MMTNFFLFFGKDGMYIYRNDNLTLSLSPLIMFVFSEFVFKLVYHLLIFFFAVWKIHFWGVVGEGIFTNNSYH